MRHIQELNKDTTPQGIPRQPDLFVPRSGTVSHGDGFHIPVQPQRRGLGEGGWPGSELQPYAMPLLVRLYAHTGRFISLLFFSSGTRNHGVIIRAKRHTDLNWGEEDAERGCR